MSKNSQTLISSVINELSELEKRVYFGEASPGEARDTLRLNISKLKELEAQIKKRSDAARIGGLTKSPKRAETARINGAKHTGKKGQEAQEK